MVVWKDGKYLPGPEDQVPLELIRDIRAAHRAKFKFLQEDGKELENKRR